MIEEVITSGFGSNFTLQFWKGALSQTVSDGCTKTKGQETQTDVARGDLK